MKTLTLYITEALHVNKNTKGSYHNYHPKDRRELMDLIEKLIKERGDDADLNDIDTSKITDMSNVFSYLPFNGDISKWNVSNVKDMYGMFWSSKFNGDISGWDVSKVQNMEDMFMNSPLEKNPPKWYIKKK